jgi:hypothetical protein
MNLFDSPAKSHPLLPLDRVGTWSQQMRLPRQELR